MRHSESRQPRFSRRGGAYILILGAATMLTVVGLGTIAVMRTSIGRVSAARDWSAAGVLAESAVEGALSRINADANWRTTFASSPTSVAISLGSGRCEYRLEDPGDGNLTNNDKDPVLVHALAAVGKAKRAYAVRVQYVPPPALDVLNYGVYATGAINCRGAARVLSGGLRSGATLTNSSTLTADVWATAITNSGTIVGEVHSGAVSLPIVSDGSLPGNSSIATVINYASISGGSIDKVLLSAGANPYGAADSNGVYVISVPALSTLTIRRSRIAATLIVQLGLSSSLVVSNEINWEKGPTNLPVLIVTATALSAVNFTGSTAQLSESAVGRNLNPASTPYQGQSDTDTTDNYTSEIRGIIHISTLLSSVTVGSNFSLVGTLITEGALTIDAGANITYDSTVLQDPPVAYRTGTSSMMPVPGSWVWEPVP